MLKIIDRAFPRRGESNVAVNSVLVPVTGEPADDDVVKFACEMVRLHRGTLYVLYVIEIERGFPIDVEIGPATAKGCLLYTSPSPRDLSTSRMPSSA